MRTDDREAFDLMLVHESTVKSVALMVDSLCWRRGMRKERKRGTRHFGVSKAFFFLYRVHTKNIGQKQRFLPPYLSSGRRTNLLPCLSSGRRTNLPAHFFHIKVRVELLDDLQLQISLKCN